MTGRSAFNSNREVRKTNRVRILLETEYRPAVARAVAGALAGDDDVREATLAKTWLEGRRVKSRIEAESLEKALSVVDDLLFCQSLSERTLSITELK